MTGADPARLPNLCRPLPHRPDEPGETTGPPQPRNLTLQIVLIQAVFVRTMLVQTVFIRTGLRQTVLIRTVLVQTVFIQTRAPDLRLA